MWEQGAEHQAEMAQMQAAYDQLIHVRVKEAREEGIKLGIGQQDGLQVQVSPQKQPASPEGGGLLADLFSFARSDDSEVVAGLRKELEALEGEVEEKEGQLQNLQADRDYYESQIAQGKGELQQVQLRVRELTEELQDARNGASTKRLEKEVRELERTLSYVKKHMFHLFKSCGQERVREYMKEVFAGNWKLSAPLTLKPDPSGSSSAELQREILALSKRCEILSNTSTEREEEMQALEKELRYAEKQITLERQRVRKAEELLVSMSSQKTKKKSLWKKLVA
eukprot:TRINITY_DN7812_c0_g1_i1.p1 TRINITY_DN7812_c0_g1~~TRINITY_DN7812_c0_g1_i1.p1  ORF type:complete len:282 (-),score=76.43 TRINITY_DN7812_c0_g1_i1:139-984(-)